MIILKLLFVTLFRVLKFIDYILTRFSDSVTIKNVLTDVYLTVIIDVTMTIISGIILCIINSKLFLLIILLTILNAILIYAFKKPYKKINLESMEQTAKINSSIIESLKGIETIKTNVNEEMIMETIEKEYIKNLKINFKQGFLSNVQGSLGGIILSLGKLGLMFVGAIFVINGDITLGTLLAFTSLATFFMEPIGRLIKVQLSIQEANISMKRISEILETSEEKEIDPGYIKINKIDKDIVLNNVTFRYGYRDPVLKDVSIKIPHGKKVALVGESGSGKTTISKLLLKFYLPESGNVEIGDIDVKNIDIYSLRKSISCVPQSIELFSGSIIDNIKVGKNDATMEEIEYACKITGCDEFINRLPCGYNSFLEEAGNGLSGGEKQRLALARAIIKNNKFLILDEATSNLDFLSESKIYNTIFNKLSNITMLIIAHRLSTIRNCDIIYVMDKGQVIESGKHEELLRLRGMYFKLWNSQVGQPNTCLTEELPEHIEVVEDDESVMTYL